MQQLLASLSKTMPPSTVYMLDHLLTSNALEQLWPKKLVTLFQLFGNLSMHRQQVQEHQ